MSFLPCRQLTPGTPGNQPCGHRGGPGTAKLFPIGNNSRRRLQEVPEVAVEILEDGDGAVLFLFWLAHEDDAFRQIGAVVAPEVVGVQEEEYTAAGLVSDPRGLLGTDGTREEQARSAAAPGGVSTTQRLSCSGTCRSSVRVKPSLPT